MGNVTENPFEGVFFNTELFDEETGGQKYEFDGFEGLHYLDSAAYHYNAGRLSVYSSQCPLSLEQGEGVLSFHIWERLTYRDALLAAVRLFDSSTYGQYDASTLTQPDREIQ